MSEGSDGNDRAGDDDFVFISESSVNDAADTEFESFVDSIERASNVLVLAPSGNDGGEMACGRLLAVGEPTEERVLYVSVTESADERIESWEGHGYGSPAEMEVVAIGESIRGSGSRMETEQGTVTTVRDPTDLARVGIVISDRLSEWEENEGRIVLCFHSLSALLQYVDLQRVFRFLHLLGERVTDAGAVAHYHLDPTIHDEQEIATLRSVFDAVVEVDENGAVHIS